MSLTTKINILLNIVHTNDLDLGEPTDDIALTRGISFTDGTGANQADIVWHDTRTLTDGESETLSLDTGSLKDAFGTELSFDILKGLYIKNNSTDAYLLVGAATGTQLGLFNHTSDILKIPPGGEFFYSAPNATGLDTTSNPDLKIAHDGTGSSSLTYDIVLVGVD